VRASRCSTTNPVSSDDSSVHVTVAEVASVAEPSGPEGAAGGIVSDTAELGDEPRALTELTRKS